MYFKSSVAVALATVVSQVVSHGLITGIQGTNGVNMPGLGLVDGTPRDCTTKNCGAQDDVPVFKEGNGPLGSTIAGGQVSAEQGVAAFMGTGAGAAGAGAAGATAAKAAKANRRGLLDDLKAKKQGAAAGNAAGAAAAGAAGGGALATGTKTPKGTTEKSVAAAAGKGADEGMPTVGADGVITMSFHQVNGDGAGPYTAAVDPTSGGTDEAAFQPATVMSNIPGTRGNDNQGRTSDFTMQVQMPAGMTCQGTIAGMNNLCVVRVKNPARAGPFGGSAVFTQESAGAANGTAAGAAGAAGAANNAATGAAANNAAAGAAGAAGAANNAATGAAANNAAAGAAGAANNAATGAAANNAAAGAAGAAGAANNAATGATGAAAAADDDDDDDDAAAAGAAKKNANRRRVAVTLRA